jgi:hypothetical protein
VTKLSVAVWGKAHDVGAWFGQMGLVTTLPSPSDHGVLMRSEDEAATYVGIISSVAPHTEAFDLLVEAAERVPWSEEAGGYRK